MQIGLINYSDKPVIFRGSVKRNVDEYVKYCILMSKKECGQKLHKQVEDQYMNSLKLLKEKVKHMHEKTQLTIDKLYVANEGEYRKLSFYNSKMRNNAYSTQVGFHKRTFPYDWHMTSQDFAKIVEAINPEEIDQLFISEAQKTLQKYNQCKNQKAAKSLLRRINEFKQDISNSANRKKLGDNKSQTHF